MKLTDRTFVQPLLLPAGMFLAIFDACPLFLLIRDSFFEASIYTPAAGKFVGLDNYARALTSTRVRESAGRTLIALSAEFVLGFAAAQAHRAEGATRA